MNGFARSVGSVDLVKGEWIAIDGSKFHTVSSARSVLERAALERYLEQLEQRDQQDEVVIDRSAVASALEKLRQHRAGDYLNLKRYSQAVRDYEKILALDPDNTTACSDRGLARFETGAYVAAISDFGEAIRLKKDGDSYLPTLYMRIAAMLRSN